MSGEAFKKLVKEKINPYGHTDVKDSVKYVRELRKKSKDKVGYGVKPHIIKNKKGSHTGLPYKLTSQS